MRRHQTGLGLIAAIMILVILGGLSAAIVSLSTGQHMSSAQDVLSAQAWQVAMAGSRGGIDQAMSGAACGGTWVSPDYPAFSVTVVCASTDYNDGEIAAGTARVLRVFNITATACNGTAAACPDNAASAGAGYVERQRVAVAACQWGGAACIGPP
ncbi:MAG: MSHA biogenesis protein MshP [Rhodocyclales bacterium]|nr:MSHA biogenesis protein MshP [Rhodocyclales bacterium]